MAQIYKNIQGALRLRKVVSKAFYVYTSKMEPLCKLGRRMPVCLFLNCPLMPRKRSEPSPSDALDNDQSHLEEAKVMRCLCVVCFQEDARHMCMLRDRDHACWLKRLTLKRGGRMSARMALSMLFAHCTATDACLPR